MSLPDKHLNVSVSKEECSVLTGVPLVSSHQSSLVLVDLGYL